MKIQHTPTGSGRNQLLQKGQESWRVRVSRYKTNRFLLHLRPSPLVFSPEELYQDRSAPILPWAEVLEGAKESLS